MVLKAYIRMKTKADRRNKKQNICRTHWQPKLDDLVLQRANIYPKQRKAQRWNSWGLMKDHSGFQGWLRRQLMNLEGKVLGVF